MQRLHCATGGVTMGSPAEGGGGVTLADQGIGGEGEDRGINRRGYKRCSELQMKGVLGSNCMMQRAYRIIS